jgi:hypothetical protein
MKGAYKVTRYVVAALAVLTSAARADATDEARQRIMNKAYSKALEDARSKPNVAVKDFIAVWRKAWDRWMIVTCGCPYTTVSYEGGTTRKRNACALGALDDFTLTILPVMVRLPGALKKLENAKDDAEGRAIGEKLATDTLDENVPPREMRQRQAKMQECFEKIGIR